MTAATAPILEARDIVKTYGHVKALEGANFSVRPGEVVALIGDNGAGKSTLTKIISGVVGPDSGELLFEGRSVEHRIALRRTGARDRDGLPGPGAGTGSRRRRERLHGPRAAEARPVGDDSDCSTTRHEIAAEQAFAQLGVAVKDAGAAVAYLSGGQRQGVAVARAVSWASRVIIMDEPTAALGVVQTENVLTVIRRVRDRGVAVVLISHNMPDVMKVADRIEVLRLGRRVAVFNRRGRDARVAGGCHDRRDHRGRRAVSQLPPLESPDRASGGQPATATAADPRPADEASLAQRIRRTRCRPPARSGSFWRWR